MLAFRSIRVSRAGAAREPETLFWRDIEEAKTLVDPATKAHCESLERSYFGWRIDNSPEAKQSAMMFDNPATGVAVTLALRKANGFSCDPITGEGRGGRVVELVGMEIKAPPGSRVLLLGSYRVSHPESQSIPMLKWVAPDASGSAKVDTWLENNGNVYATRRIWPDRPFMETHLYPMDRQVTFVVVAPPGDGVGLPRVLDRGSFVLPPHRKSEEGEISAREPGVLFDAIGTADDGSPHETRC